MRSSEQDLRLKDSLLTVAGAALRRNAAHPSMFGLGI
jgi:hypothetical protein